MISQVISYLTGNFPFAGEFVAFWMAVQGAMAVRGGPNKDGKMNWFHAFAQSVFSGFAGGILGPIWMGKSTPMLSNDVNFSMCVLAFCIVNYSPLDLGYTLAKTFPFRLVTGSAAQLFRSLGVVKFCDIAFAAFKDSPSKYYPIPVFGPILNATILGNMGGFFSKGFHGHLEKGMPLAFKNGFILASFYHFVAHDTDGPIGNMLRLLIKDVKMGLSDEVFAVVIVGLVMQLNVILQMKEFFGPSFNVYDIVLSPLCAFLGKFAPGSKRKEIPAGLKKKKKKKKTN